MTADWVAVSVRGRGLASRRLGRARTRRIASATSLDAAVAELASTPYGREVRVGMGLREAQHAVFATLIWHLRILAGWAPLGGADRVRLLAAGFEIGNIVGRLARLSGRSAAEPQTLGGLAISWPRIESARTPAEVRTRLAVSFWGDPGSEDLATVRSALHAAWARRVAEGVPEAGAWAESYATLMVARALAAGSPIEPESVAGRNLRAVLGRGWQSATSLGQLSERVPRAAASVLDHAERAEDLWRAEARWWARVETAGLQLSADPRPDAGIVVGLVALLAADAWRTRGALEVAARGGRSADWFDAVA